MAQKTRAALKAENEDNLTLFEDQQFDIIDSCYNIADDLQIGLNDYNPAVTYQPGQGAFYLGSLFRKSSGAAAGTPPTSSADWTKVGGDIAEVPVAHADDPRPELNLQPGVTGSLILARETVSAGLDILTLYCFEPDSIIEARPYIVNAAGSGSWIAIAGRYYQGTTDRAGNLSVNGTTSILALASLGHGIVPGTGGIFTGDKVVPQTSYVCILAQPLDSGNVYQLLDPPSPTRRMLRVFNLTGTTITLDTTSGSIFLSSGAATRTLLDRHALELVFEPLYRDSTGTDIGSTWFDYATPIA